MVSKPDSKVVMVVEVVEAEKVVLVRATMFTCCDRAEPQAISKQTALNQKPHRRLILGHGKLGHRLWSGCDWVGSSTIRFDVFI